MFKFSRVSPVAALLAAIFVLDAPVQTNPCLAMPASLPQGMSQGSGFLHGARKATPPNRRPSAATVFFSTHQ